MAAFANKALISPAVLGWAMDRASVSAGELAKAAGTSEKVVEAWLAGGRKPSFPQLRAAASRLRVPFGVLFLAEPPVEQLPIPDLRTLQGTGVIEASVDLRDVILATLRRQRWLSEYLRESQADPVDVVGRAGPDPQVDEVAADIREHLDLTDPSQRPARVDEFLRALVRRTEDLGVNVSRSGVVGNNTHRPLDVEEFRGFCISDDYAPFIFINGADVQSAQAFTLVHELAHIWRGDSGISGPEVAGAPPVEAFCNRVAAEVLVPAVAFVSAWDADVPIEDAVQAVARRFRVSRFVAAIRAFESGLIGRTDLEQLLDKYRQEGRRGSAGGGGDFYRTLIARNGRSFTSGVVEALSRQHVLVRDAAGLLEAKPGHLRKLRQEVSQNG